MARHKTICLWYAICAARDANLRITGDLGLVKTLSGLDSPTAIVTASATALAAPLAVEIGSVLM